MIVGIFCYNNFRVIFAYLINPKDISEIIDKTFDITTEPIKKKEPNYFSKVTSIFKYDLFYL